MANGYPVERNGRGAVKRPHASEAGAPGLPAHPEIALELEGLEGPGDASEGAVWRLAEEILTKVGRPIPTSELYVLTNKERPMHRNTLDGALRRHSEIFLMRKVKGRNRISLRKWAGAASGLRTGRSDQ
jgi:hypothetical protein